MYIIYFTRKKKIYLKFIHHNLKLNFKVILNYKKFFLEKENIYIVI
jgi:hypothetical protein